MAGRGVVRSCVQTALKAANSLVGLAGMAVILYALWVLREWSTQAAQLHRHLTVPCNWEEDFPDDPSGKFAEFKQFVRSNFDICEWVGLSVVGAQALSIILAMVLRALGPEREIDYDSDDDTVTARLPLLRNQAQDGPNYVETNLPRRNDSWTVRILDKANK